MTTHGTPTTLALRLTEVILDRMEKRHGDVEYPRTAEAFNALLDEIRPEGAGHLWPRCRKAVADKIGIRPDSTFHNWFDVMTRTR